MTNNLKRRAIQVTIVSVVFGVGFLCGSVTQRRAQAQVGELLQKAGESGGPLGSAVKLGQTISDMQTHIDGLQKNLEVLKSVKASLGG